MAICKHCGSSFEVYGCKSCGTVIDECVPCHAELKHNNLKPALCDLRGLHEFKAGDDPSYKNNNNPAWDNATNAREGGL